MAALHSTSTKSICSSCGLHYSHQNMETWTLFHCSIAIILFYAIKRRKAINSTINYEYWARQHVLESINRFTYNASLLCACWVLDFLLQIAIWSLFVVSSIWKFPFFEYIAEYSNECHSFSQHDVRNHSRNIACKSCFSGKITSNVFSVEIPKCVYVRECGWMNVGCGIKLKFSFG